jgi:hypothetical protein
MLCKLSVKKIFLPYIVIGGCVFKIFFIFKYTHLCGTMFMCRPRIRRPRIRRPRIRRRMIRRPG